MSHVAEIIHGIRNMGCDMICDRSQPSMEPLSDSSFGQSLELQGAKSPLLGSLLVTGTLYRISSHLARSAN